MVGWLKVAPQVGSQVRTASISGTVQTVTAQHVLLKTNGWNATSVWIARNQLKGMYK